MDTYKVTKYFEGAKKYPEFSKQEIEIFIQSFEEFDADGSGAIDAKELATAFKKMGQGATPEDIQSIIAKVDTDKSGQIEWVEFLAIMRDFYPWKRFDFEQNFLIPARNFPEFTKGDIEVFVDTFREFDLDGSGSIDARELGIAFRTMGQGITREEVERLIEQFDEDNSGEIEFGEFLQMMRMFYPEKRAVFERTYYEPAKKYPEFSKAEIDTFIETFKEYDIDGSGSINSQELILAFKRMGQGCDEARARSIIDEVDADGSGEIEWPEFLQIMRSFYPHKKREFERQYYEPAQAFPEFTKGDIAAFIEAFREFDLDGSGSINAQELAIAFKRMGQGCSPAQIQSIITEVDTNGSGEIEWPEFLLIMRMMYPTKLAEFKKTFYEPAKKFPEFNEDDISVFVECFREFDVDGSGTIDAHELEAAFKRMGQGVSKDRLIEIIASVDDNGNGELEWPEFLQIMHNLYTGKLVVQSTPATSAPAKTATTSTAPASNAPAKTTTTSTAPASNNAPAKTTTTSTAPAKTSTTSTAPASNAPAKSTTTSTAPASNAPAKSTTTSTTSSTAPAKSTTSTAPTSSNPPAKSTTASTGGKLPNPQCAVCGKNVYPIEEIKAVEQTFHKGCFKCSEPGCGLSLNLKNFKSANNKIFCVKHVPVAKPTSLTVDGSMSAMNAVNAPKLQKASGIKKDNRMTFGPGELPTTNSDGK